MPLSNSQRRDISDIFARLATQAGEIVFSYYKIGVETRKKADSSPVSAADLAGEDCILAGLARELPEYPVIAEERMAAEGAAPQLGESFILVDPLDGTREFITGSTHFTVNIALIVAGEPVASAVYAPALSKLWIAGVEASTAAVPPGVLNPASWQRRPIAVRRPDHGGFVAVASRLHPDQDTELYLKRLPIKSLYPVGSSLKFCLIAEGEADVYPRCAGTMEWDIAAGDAVLRSAGGIVLNGNGRPLQYGRQAQGFRTGSFIAWGDPKQAAHFPFSSSAVV